MNAWKSQGYIMTDSQSASLSWCQAPIWYPWPILPFSLWLFLDSCESVDMGRPLRREVRPVVFSFCQALPAQPFTDLSPMGLMSIFYCLPQPAGPGSRLVKVKVRLRLTVSQSVSQYVLVASSLWDLWPDIIFCLKFHVLSLWGALSRHLNGYMLDRYQV
jgi:hypothetical protein